MFLSYFYTQGQNQKQGTQFSLMPSPSIFYFFIFVHRACLSQSVATKMYISMNNRVSKTLQINNLESVFVVLSAICAISFGYDI